LQKWPPEIDVVGERRLLTIFLLHLMMIAINNENYKDLQFRGFIDSEKI
jgi:hypothetical protein